MMCMLFVLEGKIEWLAKHHYTNELEAAKAFTQPVAGPMGRPRPGILRPQKGWKRGSKKRVRFNYASGAH